MSGSTNLHGAVQEKCAVALLLIDVLNDLDFPEGEMLLEHALPMAKRIAELKRRSREAGIPCIYVNDNFGRWKSDFRALVRHCIEDDTLGRRIVERLSPGEEDYLVLKPKHSGFYSTTLDVLLRHFEVQSLILAGMAANICVLFTANDAYMRGYDIFVPRDCVASNTEEENTHALRQMEQVLKADISAADELNLGKICRCSRSEPQRAASAR